MAAAAGAHAPGGWWAHERRKDENPRHVAGRARRRRLRGHAADDAAGHRDAGCAAALALVRDARAGGAGRRAVGDLSCSSPARRDRSATTGSRWAWRCSATRSATPCCWPTPCAWSLASHAAVITALLPLVTAAVRRLGAAPARALGFWLCAIAGSALVVAFSLLRAVARRRLRLRMGRRAAGGRGLAASLGYIYGAQVDARARRRAGDLLGLRDGAARSPCPAPCVLWPAAAGRGSRPGSASSTSACSRCGWASSPGTAAWPWAAPLRVSQTQLLQPFLSILAAVPLLGEPLDVVTARLRRGRGGHRAGRRQETVPAAPPLVAARGLPIDSRTPRKPT